MPKLLFVCTGNTCRSPMAEYIFKEMLNKKGFKDNWEVMSAGLSALPGAGANEKAIKVLKEEGIDLASHISRQIDDALLDDADLILTMTRQHKEIIKEINPRFLDKVFTLKEFAGVESDSNISDPFGQAEKIYRKTRNEIREILNLIMRNSDEFQNEEGKEAGKTEIVENIILRGENTLKIAIGSDHAGYKVKEEIIKFLEEEGFSYEDMGTDSTESVDYPDFAYNVARGVASGDFERGILVCGTGIGMSIAANKVKGIRAALCHDIFSARATRNHNDSNVLTMGARIIGGGLAQEIVKVWLGAQFDGGRHEERIKKVNLIERGEYRHNE